MQPDVVFSHLHHSHNPAVVRSRGNQPTQGGHQIRTHLRQAVVAGNKSHVESLLVLGIVQTLSRHHEPMKARSYRFDPRPKLLQCHWYSVGPSLGLVVSAPLFI